MKSGKHLNEQRDLKRNDNKCSPMHLPAEPKIGFNLFPMHMQPEALTTAYVYDMWPNLLKSLLESE